MLRGALKTGLRQQWGHLRPQLAGTVRACAWGGVAAACSAFLLFTLASWFIGFPLALLSGAPLLDVISEFIQLILFSIGFLAMLLIPATVVAIMLGTPVLLLFTSLGIMSRWPYMLIGAVAGLAFTQLIFEKDSTAILLCLGAISGACGGMATHYTTAPHYTRANTPAAAKPAEPP